MTFIQKYIIRRVFWIEQKLFHLFLKYFSNINTFFVKNRFFFGLIMFLKKFIRYLKNSPASCTSTIFIRILIDFLLLSFMTWNEHHLNLFLITLSWLIIHFSFPPWPFFLMSNLFNFFHFSFWSSLYSHFHPSFDPLIGSPWKCQCTTLFISISRQFLVNWKSCLKLNNI